MGANLSASRICSALAKRVPRGPERSVAKPAIPEPVQPERIQRRELNADPDRSGQVRVEPELGHSEEAPQDAIIQ